MKPVEQPVVAALALGIQALAEEVAATSIDCPAGLAALDQALTLCQTEISEADYRQTFVQIIATLLEAQKAFRVAGYIDISQAIRTHWVDVAKTKDQIRDRACQPD